MGINALVRWLSLSKPVAEEVSTRSINDDQYVNKAPRARGWATSSTNPIGTALLREQVERTLGAFARSAPGMVDRSA